MGFTKKSHMGLGFPKSQIPYGKSHSGISHEEPLIMKKGDMNVFKYYHRKIDGQIYMAQIDEGCIHDIANSQSEYYKKIKEKTQEIANWDLDQEEIINRALFCHRSNDSK